MPNAKQLLYQTWKNSHQRFSIKMFSVFKKFPILTGKYMCEVFKNAYFEEYLRTTASYMTL